MFLFFEVDRSINGAKSKCVKWLFADPNGQNFGHHTATQISARISVTTQGPKFRARQCTAPRRGAPLRDAPGQGALRRAAARRGAPRRSALRPGAARRAQFGSPCGGRNSGRNLGRRVVAEILGEIRYILNRNVLAIGINFKNRWPCGGRNSGRNLGRRVVAKISVEILGF